MPSPTRHLGWHQEWDEDDEDDGDIVDGGDDDDDDGDDDDDDEDRFIGKLTGEACCRPFFSHA